MPDLKIDRITARVQGLSEETRREFNLLPPNCNDSPCNECEEEGCPCICHTRHERIDLDEYDGFGDGW